MIDRAIELQTERLTIMFVGAVFLFVTATISLLSRLNVINSTLQSQITQQDTPDE